MDDGEGFTFCGGEGGVYFVEGEADVLVGSFVERGEVGVWREAWDAERIIVGCH